MLFTRRLVLAAFALSLLLPLSGCGCRRSCSSCPPSASFAPPPGPCCDKGVPPGYLPPPVSP
jgi:hypothetical protein